MQHWYVYYKLPHDQREDAVARVRRMQERICAAVNVRARVLERTDQAETTTVMEVYEDIDNASLFEALLHDAVQASGLTSALMGARRIERFRDA